MEYIHNNDELYFQHDMKICKHCNSTGIVSFLHSIDVCGICHGTGIYIIDDNKY